jgi:hypothetical protein
MLITSFVVRKVDKFMETFIITKVDIMGLQWIQIIFYFRNDISFFPN